MKQNTKLPSTNGINGRSRTKQRRSSFVKRIYTSLLEELMKLLIQLFQWLQGLFVLLNHHLVAVAVITIFHLNQ